jgi:Ion channel
MSPLKIFLYLPQQLLLYPFHFLNSVNKDLMLIPCLSRYFDALYFCFVALLTIGYGDFEVSSPAGKAAFVFWAFLAVPTMTILVASMGATFLMAVKAIIHKIDDFVVLPHESGRKDSYLNKVHKMGKLKAKEKFGHRLGWHEHKDGRERHWHPVHGEGIRNPDTGSKFYFICIILQAMRVSSQKC